MQPCLHNIFPVEYNPTSDVQVHPIMLVFTLDRKHHIDNTAAKAAKAIIMFSITSLLTTHIHHKSDI